MTIIFSSDCCNSKVNLHSIEILLHFSIEILGENTRQELDVLDPENSAQLDSAFKEMERREYRSHPSRNNEALVKIRAHLQGIIEEERNSISSFTFDKMGD